jgi:acyl-coenzyme A synthetase/AMP-(fatty) acid ligase/acyl carrier protein
VNGCRLAILPDGPVNPYTIAEAVRAYGVTMLVLTTGLLHQMIIATLFSFAEVRHVLAGGEVASVQLVNRLLEAHPGLLFTNGYGPTENTSFTTCWTSSTPSSAATVPVGMPISGTRITVLDGAGRQVPPGAVGELYAAGDGLARGYINRPALTAELFVPDPYGPPGARAYRTGDLVRRLSDGTVEFVGRIDAQTKIQGYRVEPAAVEESLSRLADVDQAAVVVQADAGQHKRLVAYVVAARPAAGDVGEAVDTARLEARIGEELRGVLPAYMVPSNIVVLPELPPTRNGKVDRRLLKNPGRRPRRVANEFVPPTTPLERRLAERWSELLDVQPVGIDDDFFELGGHSLLATELIDALDRDLGLKVPTRTFYLHPTIAELAAAVSSPTATGSADRGIR